MGLVGWPVPAAEMRLTWDLKYYNRLHGKKGGRRRGKELIRDD
jgi:hypothetical protein